MTLVETNIPHAEMLGIAESDTKYRKREFGVCDVDIISSHFWNARQAACKAKEIRITADKVELGIADKYHPAIWEMLRKHEHLWSGNLGCIFATKHRIELIPHSRPFKSAPYRTGPKTRELEEFEIKKHLSVDVIEPSNAE